MKNLSHLKADCVSIKRLSDYYEDNPHFLNAYEWMQRKIAEAEYEVFCPKEQL